MSFSTVTLSEIAKPVVRPIAVVPGTSYRTIGVKWWGEGAYERETIDGTQTAANTLSIVREDDLIINKIWVRHGSTAIATKVVDGCAASGEFPTFELDNSRILPRWMHWLTKNRDFWQKCDNLSRGTSGKNRIRPELFLVIEIPLPPLEEQQRIVARIEELVAKIEKAQRLHQEALEAAKALNAATTNTLFNLTTVNGWPIVELGDIADIYAGVTLGRTLNGPTIRLPYLRVANVQDGFLDLSNIKETEILPSEFEKWQLKSGDILLTEGGDWDKLGRGAVWHAEIPNCIHQNHIFCVRTNTDDFNPNFLLAVISSPYGKGYFQGVSKQTTNLASINQKQLKAFKVFQPPLSEQDRIMAYFNDLQAKVSMLKAAQSVTSTALDAVLPSILDKAFKGEL